MKLCNYVFYRWHTDHIICLDSEENYFSSEVQRSEATRALEMRENAFIAAFDQWSELYTEFCQFPFFIWSSACLNHSIIKKKTILHSLIFLNWTSF